jgi:hypothetical protein
VESRHPRRRRIGGRRVSFAYACARPRPPSSSGGRFARTPCRLIVFLTNPQEGRKEAARRRRRRSTPGMDGFGRTRTGTATCHVMASYPSPWLHKLAVWDKLAGSHSAPCLVLKFNSKIALCKKEIPHHIKMSANTWSTKCR